MSTPPAVDLYDVETASDSDQPDEVLPADSTQPNNSITNGIHASIVVDDDIADKNSQSANFVQKPQKRQPADQSILPVAKKKKRSLPSSLALTGRTQQKFQPKFLNSGSRQLMKNSKHKKKDSASVITDDSMLTARVSESTPTVEVPASTLTAKASDSTPTCSIWAPPALASADKPLCRYGAQCYRTNPQHRRDFYHPATPSKSKRAKCRYGSRCYQQSARHREAFAHPGDSDYDDDPIPATDSATNASKKITPYFSRGDAEDWGLYSDMDCSSAVQALNTAMEQQMNAAFESIVQTNGACSAQDAQDLAQKVVNAVGSVQDKHNRYGASDSDAQRLLCMAVEDAFQTHLGVDVEVERPQW